MPEPAKFLTVKEVADQLGVGQSTVRQWVMKRKITSYRVGGRRVFKQEDVNHFVEGGKTEADPK